MEQIGGTWKAPILWRLRNKTMRYGELRKDIPHISDKMLTTQLKEPEEDGYIHREVYAVVPPKTEYSLTEQGVEIIELITAIRNYGLKMIENKDRIIINVVNIMFAKSGTNMHNLSFGDFYKLCA
jgi:DNA-binding HxlR family transcriptional regulator